MQAIESLPLFPLQQPLFPGVPMPLRIFEQRYLTLVRNAMRDQSPFGIVPILSGKEVGAPAEIHPWGTLVTIRDWDQLDDGLLGITVEGEQRLRVGAVQVQRDGLMRGEAHILPADPLEPLCEEDLDLLRLLEDLATQLQLPHLLPGEDISVSVLGWRLLTLLPFDLAWRLELLEEDDPEQRLLAIRRHLTQLSQS